MLRLALVGLTVAAAIAAQSPLTTTFANNNAGSVGGGLYFDLNVTNAAGITIIGLDLNVSGTGSIEVYRLIGSRIGFQANPSAWTLVATGPVAGAPGVAAPVAINPIVLPAGAYGFALKAIGIAHHYTTGGQSSTTSELTLAAGEASNTAFAMPLFSPRTVNCNIHYANGASGTLATNTVLGAGCIDVAEVSSYEDFATSAAFDLSNTSITLLHIGTGYLALPGFTTYVPPSATAQGLTLGDNTETTVALSQPMPVGASSTTAALTVCSNGFISAGTGNLTSPTPAPSVFLNGPQAWWSLCWHDYDPTNVSGGRVKFEQIGNIAYITWDGVWDFAGSSAANASTMQAQFDVTTGTVHYVYGTMSTLGNGRLVGFSSGGPSADPGSMDISAALPSAYTAAVFPITPLVLAGASRPVVNTSWALLTGNIPPSGVIGVDVFGLFDPGITDLSFAGMPGCGLRASLDVVHVWPVVGATHAYGLAIPNSLSLLNAHVFTTSAVFQVPVANAFGAIIANGIDGKIGDL